MLNILQDSILVGLGASLGALIRYLFTLYLPYPILLVNVIGSFVIGFTSVKFAAQNQVLLLVNIGFLGALTTFSSFSSKVLNYLNQGEFLAATFYILLSVLISITACYAGYRLAII